VPPPRTETAGGLRAAHKERTRTALVGAALSQFAARGYAAVTVEDICAEAGVSPRTFFRYFATKEHVLAAPVAAVLDTLGASLAAQPDSVSAWTALRRAALDAVSRVDEQAEVFLLASQVIRDNPGALAANAEALIGWEQRMDTEIQRRLGAADGSLHPRLLLGTAMLAFRVALDRWADLKGAGPARADLEEALDAVAPGATALQRAAGRAG
jgi:AcrR family transcriptional regulator